MVRTSETVKGPKIRNGLAELYKTDVWGLMLGSKKFKKPTPIRLNKGVAWCLFDQLHRRAQPRGEAAEPHPTRGTLSVIASLDH